MFKYQPQWQGPLSGPSFEKQTEDFLNGIESRVDEIDTRQTPSDAMPMPPGTGSAGTELEYSRGDHVHPEQASVTGNAGTATALQTARNIAIEDYTGQHVGTAGAFDGTSDVRLKLPHAMDGELVGNASTASKLQTARTISMADEGSGSVSFDGSADVSLALEVSCTAAGTTADRRIADRFADVANVKDFGAVGDGVTDDTMAVQAAVTACLNAGSILFWPNGTYLCSGSLSSVHGVMHSGSGKIKRGADIFTPGNTQSSANTLYVDGAGSDANDGLSASTPLKTVQAAIDALANYGPLLKGTWSVSLAAGTYAKGRFRDQGIQSEDFIEFRGPDVGGHPNVPTAIISNGGGHSGNGLFILNHTNVKCSNIKFVGYNGSVGSTGIYINNNCYIKTENCHFDSCSVGVRGYEYCIIDVKGGIFENCAYDQNGSPYASSGAILGDFHGKFSVGTQHAGNLDNGPIFQNNYLGVLAQEHCDGHIDYCTFYSNATHIRFNICTRLNVSGSSFKKASGIGIWLQQNSLAYLNSITLGTGTDANFINYICDTYSSIDVYYATAGTISPSITDRCIKRAVLGEVIQNTTPKKFFETSFLGQLFAEGYSSYAIPKAIRFCVRGSLSGTAGIKYVTARFGGSPATGIQFANTQTGQFVFRGEIILNNNPSMSQSCGSDSNIHQNPSRVNYGSLANDLTSDFLFDLEANVADASDSITIASCEVYLSGV